jgi:hypothetical protein
VRFMSRETFCTGEREFVYPRQNGWWKHAS